MLAIDVYKNVKISRSNGLVWLQKDRGYFPFTKFKDLFIFMFKGNR